MIFFIGLRVYGGENIPKSHPFIIVANHSSHLDAAALLSLFSLKNMHNIRPVAAADYFNQNAFRSFIVRAFFNVLMMDRYVKSKHEDPLKPLEQALHSGQSLIFFPEGTRSVTGEIGQFHSGIAHIIERFPTVPVIPVYMTNLFRSLPKGEVLPVPFFSDIYIGKPVCWTGGRPEIVASIRDAVIALQREERTF